MTEPVFQPVPQGASDDDRMWVLLSFLLTPIVPILMLVLEEKKSRPFIKYHAAPTLILGILEGIVVFILSFIPVIRCLTPLFWIINLFYGLKAYKGVLTDLPVITAFSKGQGWS